MRVPQRVPRFVREAVGHRRVVYFDKGALSELWRNKTIAEPSLRRVRRRLVSPYFHRRPRILLGPKILTELAPLHGRRQFADEIRFLRSVPDILYLRADAERMRLEVAAALDRKRCADPI